MSNKKKNKTNAETPVIKVEDVKIEVSDETADAVMKALVSELQAVEKEKEVVTEVVVEENKEIKHESIYGEVNLVTPYYITVTVNGSGIRKNGTFNLKPKDIVDITTL